MRRLLSDQVANMRRAQKNEADADKRIAHEAWRRAELERQRENEKNMQKRLYLQRVNVERSKHHQRKLQETADYKQQMMDF